MLALTAQVRAVMTTLSRYLAVLAVVGAVAGCGNAGDQPAREGPETRRAERAATPRSVAPPNKIREKRPVSRHGDAGATSDVATYVACDANITVKAATTTCAFAQNVFYAYWNAGGSDFQAYSPVSERSYDVRCSGGSIIACSAGDGAEVRFSAHAVTLYDEAQADAYAASHDLGPPAAADETHDNARYDGSDEDEYVDRQYGDDVGYEDGDGVTEPGENIPYYDEGRGYRVQCADGTYSQSGGIQGACSHHGGVG